MAEEAETLTGEYLSATAENLSHRFPGADIEAVVTRQNPVRSILDSADHLENPMVVMATHGRRGLRRLLFGSVADQVIRNSQVPTLLVKRGAGDARAEQ
jgi:nucleotide-binding universal stress UspA family protein